MVAYDLPVDELMLSVPIKFYDKQSLATKTLELFSTKLTFSVSSEFIRVIRQSIFLLDQEYQFN